jgi:uncharacterized protein YutE (UPF0331/DUF86 family)
VEELDRRLATAEAALATLDEAVALTSRTEVQQESAVLRLVYTFETAWQACQALVQNRGATRIGTAHLTIQAADRIGWFSKDEIEAVFAVLRDRNLVTHTYRADIAEQIETRLATHATALRRWLDILRERATDR